jgi:hypothetical protein
VCVPASSLARQARLFEGSFGSATSVPTDPYPLSSEPGGVAVDDAAHDVYVTDTGNHRVEKFAPSGEFLLAFGADVGGPGVNVCGGLVSCTTGTPGSAPGQLTTPTYIAVDNSSGPSKGDVYVADTKDNIVSKFDSSGNLVSGWGKGGQLDGSSVSPPAPLPGPFGPLYGVAVDPSGNLWVHGSAEEKNGVNSSFKPRLFEFKQDASFLTDWKAPYLEIDKGIAVDSEDNVYIGGTVAFKFDSTGNEIGQINLSALDGRSQKESGGVDTGFDANSVTIDPASNDIYLGADRQIAFYESCHPAGFKACVPTEFFGSGHLGIATAVAVDPAPLTVYAVEQKDVVAFITATVPDVTTANASNLAPSSATLDGTVNPDGALLREGLEGCRFEWGETVAYGHVAPCDKSAAQIGTGVTPVEVHANVTGLVSGKTYHFRLVAGNANDVNEKVDEPSVGQDVVFGPPLIDSESAVNVAATSVTLEAQVNPQNVDTQVQVEYGTDASYGQVTQPIGVPPVDGDQGVSEEIQSLLPSTVYHYRVVVSSVLGTLEGEDRTFETQAVGAPLALLDGRQWELVSPPNKHGGLIFHIGAEGASLKSSLSGSMVTYALTRPTEANVEGFVEGSQVLSSRGVGGGWSSQDISTAHAAAVGDTTGGGQEYRAFSEDLSVGLVQQIGPFTSLAPGAFPPDSERTPYLRHDMTCASEPGTCFEPLATGVEGFADVPAGTKFGGSESSQFSDVNFVDATPDLTHVIVASTAQLTETVTRPGVRELYEWSADKPAGERLELVSRLEKGEPSDKGAYLGDEKTLDGANARNAVSADGSRVVWTGGQPDEAGVGLYLRDLAKGQTVRLGSVQEGAAGTGDAHPLFQIASSDASHVFFTDEQRLTADSGASNYKPDLYECAIVERAGNLACELQDLTPLRGEESAAVQHTVLGTSEDGSWLYFVTNGVLGESGKEGAVPGNCQHAQAEPVGATCNLYVLHRAASGWERPRLVALLSSEDHPDWTDLLAEEGAYLAEHTARVSPNGEWLAFVSQRALTGYDNRDAVSGVPDEEVFLYRASAGGAGRLVCASCNPTGARPSGVEYAKVALGLVGGNSIWNGDQWLAGSLPGWTKYSGQNALYQSRYLSNEGRLFFNSSDALVPQDINKNEDVYEYEPGGVGGSGGCSASSATFSASAQGCIGLISSGTAAGESAFIDASENGGDVFFLTGQKLVGGDVDNALDLYDAHACTSVSPCASEPSAPPACTTADACRVAPEPQPAIFGSPSSATFSGAGNVTPAGPAPTLKPRALTRAQKLAAALRACRRDRSERRRVACKQRARKRYGAKLSRKGGVSRMGKATSGSRG